MTILLWNIEWAERRTKRGQAINSIVNAISPDVLCLTETPLDMLPDDGHAISAHADYGYASSPQRRKVVLWSKTPWSDVDSAGSSMMPSGRYISGITAGTRFTAVCIPWRDAHVRTGRKDRSPWEDHKAFLAGLNPIIRNQVQGPAPLCLLGDFNQRIPRKKQPADVYELLHQLMSPALNCVTSTDVLPEYALIDHVVHDVKLKARVLKIIPKTTEDGLRLSDHEGLVLEIVHR